jgi:hypothetical protein
MSPLSFNFIDIALGVAVWVIVGLTLAKLKGASAFAIAWVAGLAFAALFALGLAWLGQAPEMTMTRAVAEGVFAALGATLVAVFFGPRAK